MSEVPVDVTRLTESFGDDYEFLNDTYQIFLDDTQTRIAELVDVVESSSAEHCAAVAHAIKGASENVGAETMSAIAGAMELDGRAGDMSNAPSNLKALQAEFEKASAFIVDYLDSIRP